MLPGTSRLILVASEKHPRYSEGDVIELKDGRLLLALARKEGASDYAKGTLIQLISENRGVSWSDEPRVIQEAFDDVGDLMSVSLFRTKRGLHLLFLGRGSKVQEDTRIYQMISTDEGATWSKPIRVSSRQGYHIVNNARINATDTGRLIVPIAWVSEDISKQYNNQRVFCLLSDDAGETWKESSELILENEPLMEPGVAQCGDGSLYMTIRTRLGVLYEARSRDNGATWGDLGPSKLDSPAAPSTVFRDPNSQRLWMFWINRPKGAWKQRTPLAFAWSEDHGKTWSPPRNVEDAKDHSYGYFSIDCLGGHALLTYYDWTNRGQSSFHLTSLRQRTIPLAWLRGEIVPPVFSTERATEPDDRAGAAAMIQNERGTWLRFEPVRTPEGKTSAIGRAASSDGKSFPPPEIVLEPDPASGDPPDAQFIAMTVMPYRGFYLGMLHVLHERSGAVQPEWTWSHDGQSWNRTWTGCIPLGDEGAFDSRGIFMGAFELSAAKLIYRYRGAAKKGTPRGAGLAVMQRDELDKWLDSLPQP